MANNLRVDTIQDINGKVIYSQTSNSAQIGDSSLSGTSITLPQRYPTPPADYSDSTSAPTRVYPHTDGHFYMEGSAVNSAQVGGDVDYFTFRVGSLPITELYLSYYSSVDTVGFFAIQQGSQWTAGQNPSLMLNYAHIGPTTTKPQGSNLISGYTLQPNTDYTVWVQQTGSNIMYWAISTNSAYQGRDNSEKYTFQNLTVTNKLTTSRLRVNTRLQLGNNTRAVLDLGAATDAILVPRGTEAQRSSSTENGQIRYNTETQKLEGYYASKWQSFNFITPAADPGNGGGFSVAQGADSTNINGYTNTGMTQYISPWYLSAGGNGAPLNYTCSGSSSNFAFHTGHNGNSTQWPFYFAIRVTSAEFGKVLNQIQWYKHSNACGNVDVWGSNQSITSANYNVTSNYTYLGRVNMGGFGSAGDCNISTGTFNANSYGYQWYMLQVQDISGSLAYPSVGTLNGWAMYGLRLNKV